MSAPLAKLGSLDRSLLHVFVAGPGLGEGIAVALPEGGWFLVDGCRTKGPPRHDLPLLAGLDRWREDPSSDPVSWMVLTHPHQDHVAGFAEILDRVSPKHVGLVGPPPPGRSLLDEIRSSEKFVRFTDQEMGARQVIAAAKAIERWEMATQEHMTALHEGIVLRLGDAVRASVRAPEAGRATALLDLGWPSLRRRANEMSLVIDLLFGDTRIVLGGDLPRVRRASGSTTPIPTGWDRVMDTYPFLGASPGLKVPHHASRDALHEKLLEGGEGEATWITPFSRRRLPNPDDGRGLAQVLEKRSPALLTALPTRRDRQPVSHHPARLGRQAYRELVQAVGDTGFAGGAIDLRPTDITDPLSPIWATAFDMQRRVRGRWRGEVALEIVP